MNPHSFFDLSLWCIRFYFIIRFSLSNTPFARVFCVTWGEGEKSGIPRRSRAEAAKHGAEKGQKPFPPTKPSRAQPADNPLLCAKRCA